MKTIKYLSLLTLILGVVLHACKPPDPPEPIPPDPPDIQIDGEYPFGLRNDTIHFDIFILGNTNLDNFRLTATITDPSTDSSQEYIVIDTTMMFNINIIQTEAEFIIPFFDKSGLELNFRFRATDKNGRSTTENRITKLGVKLQQIELDTTEYYLDRLYTNRYVKQEGNLGSDGRFSGMDLEELIPRLPDDIGTDEFQDIMDTNTYVIRPRKWISSSNSGTLFVKADENFDWENASDHMAYDFFHKGDPQGFVDNIEVGDIIILNLRNRDRLFPVNSFALLRIIRIYVEEGVQDLNKNKSFIQYEMKY